MSNALSWGNVLASRADRMRASEIRELLKLLDQPDIISFAGGIPDPSLFPTVAAKDATSEILSDPARAGQAMQYSVSEGYAPLRQWIAAHMGRPGVAHARPTIFLSRMDRSRGSISSPSC